MTETTTRVLFVCLGNICRSPTAHAVMQRKVEQQGLGHRIFVDSAGTADWHSGKSPDKRAIAAGAKRHYDLSGLKARQVSAQDFDDFDYVLAMDSNNLSHLNELSSPFAQTQPQLFLSYATGIEETEVPDPYYGESDGFEHVLDLVENACDGLLHDIQSRWSQ